MSVPGGNRLTYRAARLGRRATASTRALPDFVIAGAARCGTTSLYRYLVEHPLVMAAQIKEVHFVDRRHNLDKGERWYRSWFPTSAALEAAAAGHEVERAICGESTPNYFAHPDAASRLRAVVPEARIILLLREPIDRVWSQYRWQRWWGGETLDLADALHAEAERAGAGFEMMGGDRQTRNRFISHGYLARSRYADQLDWWLAAYPRRQLLVLRSEDLFADPAAVLDRTFAFLGLPPFDLSTYDIQNRGNHDGRSANAIEGELRAWLEECFAEPNRRLAELTRDLPAGPVAWP